MYKNKQPHLTHAALEQKYGQQGRGHGRQLATAPWLYPGGAQLAPPPLGGGHHCQQGPQAPFCGSEDPQQPPLRQTGGKYQAGQDDRPEECSGGIPLPARGMEIHPVRYPGHYLGGRGSAGDLPD